MTIADVAAFYAAEHGERLIDENRYPPEIALFVREEAALLDTLAPSFDGLLEAGCMHGRYLDWAVRHEKAYLGLDIVARYVERGRALAAARGLDPCRHRFVLGAAEQLDAQLGAQRAAERAARWAVLFPFNSFGNVPDPAPVIDALCAARAPFLVSSYATSPRATDVRARYYRNCGYGGVRALADERGVCFVAAEGLRSFAYDPRYLTALFAARGIALEATPFAEIGIAYAAPAEPPGRGRN